MRWIVSGSGWKMNKIADWGLWYSMQGMRSFWPNAPLQDHTGRVMGHGHDHRLVKILPWFAWVE